MQNELTPGANNLQPQSSSLQEGQAGLQQTGGVSTSDGATSILSEQPKTDQLRVVTQGQPSTTALPVPVQNNPPVGLWFLFAMSFVFIAIGLILRRRSNAVQPTSKIVPEPILEPTTPESPLKTSVKPAKNKKKQSRKKRTAKR